MSIRGLRLARRFPALTAVTLCAFTGCASSTVLNSQPQGAQVAINGRVAGVTPYRYSDVKLAGSQTRIRLEAPGYEPLDVKLQRNEQFDPLAIIAGCFLLVPFLWITKYSPTHTYTLVPAGAGAPAVDPGAPVPPPGYPAPEPGPAGYPPPPPGYPPPAPTN